MTIFSCVDYINELLVAPSVLLFFGVSLILTIKTKFVQIYGIPRFFSLIFNGVKRKKESEKTEGMTTFQALFTAMATTIGIGNVVSPSLAIVVGGPGALFWMLFYMFFGSVAKYTEVTFALVTRKYLPDGFILGGPVQYLKSVSDFLAKWYACIIILTLTSWSASQSNTLANIIALEGFPQWTVGFGLAVFVIIALAGGAHRVGQLATQMVPIMFVLYVFFSFSIIVQNPSGLFDAISLVFHHAFTPAAAMGGFLGASVLRSMREGMIRGIFITEAGLGTSSIPHSLADTKRPTDQALLAMGSMMADALLSALSGILVLMTNVWSYGNFRTTLLYEVFKLNAPGLGQYVLLFTISLFVITTVMGNSFNGMQSLGVLTRDNKHVMRIYMIINAAFIFIGSVMDMKLLWGIVDILVVFVAIPNLIGLVILSYRNPEVLNIKE